ncbi:uncharacterized protein Dwil_GK22915 [Drosophila willistoni]|uniref:DUF4794 domain-containing protein n=1 Tax=Drosophila willistoni TaxID=7260 RepID=B4NNC5_DROWI|nr:uncharacterized protein LOC6652275 isoform X1 [Drosophila willistoni]EDW85864.2 uncharacterized protein Dwil_GK22915 [Drosophila willistoni]
MFATQQLWLLCLLVGTLFASPIKGSEEEPLEDKITEDVVSIDNELQKVIRVMPQELPPKQDHTGNQMNSALFQIQPLRPGGPRQYLDSKRMRRPRPGKLMASSTAPSTSTTNTGEESQQPALNYPYNNELKAFPKQKQKQQKQLHFILDSDGESSQAIPVAMTPGPYPIYYVVSKTNGRFGKFPIKAFRTPAEFSKYLIKSKAEPIPRVQRFEGLVRR